MNTSKIYYIRDGNKMRASCSVIRINEGGFGCSGVFGGKPNEITEKAHKALLDWCLDVFGQPLLMPSDRNSDDISVIVDGDVCYAKMGQSSGRNLTPEQITMWKLVWNLVTGLLVKND